MLRNCLSKYVCIRGEMLERGVLDGHSLQVLCLLVGSQDDHGVGGCVTEDWEVAEIYQAFQAYLLGEKGTQWFAIVGANKFVGDNEAKVSSILQVCVAQLDKVGGEIGDAVIDAEKPFQYRFVLAECFLSYPGGLPTTASKPVCPFLGCPYLSKNTSGNSSSQWKKRRWLAIVEAVSNHCVN